MTDHFIATIGCGRLRIFGEGKSVGQRAPRLELVEDIDFPSHAAEHDDNRDTWADPGEKLAGGVRAALNPLAQRGQEARRNLELLASELDTFLQNRPTATWDFAAAPSHYHAVFDQLSNDTRVRLQRVLSRAIVNHRAEDVRAQFAAAAH